MKYNLSRRVFIKKGATAGIGLAMMNPALSTLGNEFIVIAQKGKAAASIVLPEHPSKSEIFAAKELADYLNKITGAKFLVQNSAENLGGSLIYIGKSKISLSPEGFRINTEGNNLMLTGSDDAGVEFSVYTFLEKYLGVRWLWPGELGEVIPEKKTLIIGKIDDTQTPDFLWRNRGPEGALWGATTGPTEMHARELLLGITEEHQLQVRLWEKRNKWGGWKVYGGHVLGEIFPPQKFALTHPEYYALVNGKRAVPGAEYDYKHGGQICTTKPGVISTTVEWVNNFYDNHPDYQGVHISMNDGRSFCECDRCRSLDSGSIMEIGGNDRQETKETVLRLRIITDRIFTYANQVAKEVQKTHPGKYIFCFAYGPMELPPQNIKLHPYVIPQYTLSSAYMHSNARLKAEHESIAAGWANRANLEAIYEYYINGSWPGLPRLAVSHYSNSIRYLKSQGYKLFQTQSGDEFGTNGLNYYVTGKLLWNTSQDENKILDDFYEKGFGSSAFAIKRYINRLEKAWGDATRDGHNVTCKTLKEEVEPLTELFNDKLLKKCSEDLDLATRRASTITIKNRVEFYRKGLRYTKLTIDAVAAAKALRVTPNKETASTALDACQRRQQFVEGVKNEYVLPYFWIQYNDTQRKYLPSVSSIQTLLNKMEG